MDFTPVWYASEDRLRSRSKFIVRDDIGQLAITDGKATFSGSSTSIELSELGQLHLVTQSLPLFAYLIANIVTLPFYAAFYLAIHSMTGQSSVVPFAVIALFVNAFGVAVGKSTHWVALEGKLPSGVRARCYFADASRGGWGGIFGGTRRLFGEAQRVVSGADDAAY